MKMKKVIAPLLLAGFLLGTVVAPSFAAPSIPQGKNQQDAKKSQSIAIPKEVKDVLLKGLPTREARQDIPFSIFKSVYFPAQAAYYIFPFLKIKNADLGFAPAEAPVAPAQAKVSTTFHVFMQFHKMENGAPVQIVKETYIPGVQEQDAATYDPNKEEWYTVGYPLSPGNYLLAMAIASKDLKKIGTQYYEFTLPDAGAFAKELGTTAVLFLKDYKELGAVEPKYALHREALRYSILQFVPHIDNVFSVGESLDLFLMILGAQPNAENKYDIECLYEAKKGDEAVIKFAPAKYDNPYISQPLPLKQTFQTTKGAEVTQEEKDLPAGSYTFTIKITDKISGKTCLRAVDFTVK